MDEMDAATKPWVPVMARHVDFHMRYSQRIDAELWLQLSASYGCQTSTIREPRAALNLGKCAGVIQPYFHMQPSTQWENGDFTASCHEGVTTDILWGGKSESSISRRSQDLTMPFPAHLSNFPFLLQHLKSSKAIFWACQTWRWAQWTTRTRSTVASTPLSDCTVDRLSSDRGP